MLIKLRRRRLRRREKQLLARIDKARAANARLKLRRS